MGHVLQAGGGQITARQAAANAGIPMTVPAVTVNKVCLSGINAIILADQMIRLGEADVVVAGGMESMTNAPHLLEKSREGSSTAREAARPHGPGRPLGRLHRPADGRADRERQHRRARVHPGRAGRVLGRGHQLAAKAWKDGFFDDEVVSVVIPQRKGEPIE